MATTAAGRALLRRLRTRKNAYLAKRLRGLELDEVETLERASTILERLLDEERGDGMSAALRRSVTHFRSPTTAGTSQADRLAQRQLDADGR